jgi:hypothetical protein
MTTFSIKVFQPDNTDIMEQPLPLDENNSECAIRLRTPAGASGLHLLFLESGEPKLRMEMATHENEEVDIRVTLDKQGKLHAWGTNEENFLLPLSGHYYPDKLIPPPTSEQQLDISIIIDATMRVFADEKVTENGVEKRHYAAKLLIEKNKQKNKQTSETLSEEDKQEDKPTWTTYTETLSAFIEAIVKDTKNCKITVLAFGDQKPPNINALGLVPRYHLWPEKKAERFLQPLKPEQITHILQSIEATSGGDFVDALADALIACVHLNWRRNTRKLVLVFGDSPGHSILHPVPRGGDLCARKADVDTAAMHLHQMGVEILTLYNAPSEEIVNYFKEVPGSGFKLLPHTQKQYQRLASLPELAFQVSDFDPVKAAEIFCNRTVSIGRGMVFGEFLDEQSS